MSTILGVHDGHNGAAAFLKHGRIAAAVQEERLTRSKNEGGVPCQAICDVLKMACVDLDEIKMPALDGTFKTYNHWDRDAPAARHEQSRGSTGKLKQHWRCLLNLRTAANAGKHLCRYRSNWTCLFGSRLR